LNKKYARSKYAVFLPIGMRAGGRQMSGSTVTFVRTLNICPKHHQNLHYLWMSNLQWQPTINETVTKIQT